MSAEIDRVFGEIADLSRILHEMPNSSIARRLDIQAEIDELKALARSLARQQPLNAAALRRQIDGLERAVRAIDARKINVAASSGGSPGGDFGFTVDAMNINRAIDAGTDRARLVDLLRDARAKLAEIETQRP